MAKSSFPTSDNPKDLPDDFNQTAYKAKVPPMGEVENIPDNDNMNKAKPAYPGK